MESKPMTKGGRLASYRWGDRAEDLGIVLLKAVCAVAPVPRQEDWGVFDAIATVLRREDRLLFADGSFLVQFKSSGGNKLKFTGAKLENLRSQELPLFVASVDLRTASIGLYPIGPALFNPSAQKVETVVFHLQEKKFAQPKNEFHIFIGPPALRWNIAEMNNVEIQDRIVLVLMSWITSMKLLIQKSKLGIFDKTTWTTGETPTMSSFCKMSHPSDDEVGLEISSQSLEWLVMQALSHNSIIDPVIQIAEWYSLRGFPVNTEFLKFRKMQLVMDEMIQNAVKNHPDSFYGQAVLLIETDDDTFSFWVGQSGRAQKITGSVDELAAKGFKVEIKADGKHATLVDVTAPWINESKAKFLKFVDDVILYKRVDGNQV